MNAFLQKIPKPVLVFVVLAVALGLFVYNDPLRDECGVQGEIFSKNTQEILSISKIGKKRQFPQITYWRSRCRKGNSVGACEDYFEGLRKVSHELKRVSEHCQPKLLETNTTLVKEIVSGVQIMALAAWGEKPPAGAADRLGWLNESDIRSFCYLKRVLPTLAGEEAVPSLREKVYAEYPDSWSEKFDVNSLITSTDEDLDVAKLVNENRPRAYKTAANPAGTLTKEQVYERSLFSIRCDLYM